ncbi:hypothetical protein SAMN04488020_10511 [Palleronia marisminoris]|uniref:Uncharacterized protein n=1 Tax=Palleronia marisminoris TaxID=315423 RepID=A0A1Y5SP51_9RHOB|nr:hypothetical protein SAMN04488020_10511 [Palleronia marisminoris]SLN44999.1 hypothetical protein PAM7066_01956 [Palleronia marisminoris]
MHPTNGTDKDGLMNRTGQILREATAASDPEALLLFLVGM